MAPTAGPAHPRAAVDPRQTLERAGGGPPLADLQILARKTLWEHEFADTIQCVQAATGIPDEIEPRPGHKPAFHPIWVDTFHGGRRRRCEVRARSFCLRSPRR